MIGLQNTFEIMTSNRVNQPNLLPTLIFRILISTVCSITQLRLTKNQDHTHFSFILKSFLRYSMVEPWASLRWVRREDILFLLLFLLLLLLFLFFGFLFSETEFLCIALGYYQEVSGWVCVYHLSLRSKE